MNRTMKMTAVAMLTLAGALVGTTALADRGNGMGAGMGMGAEIGMRGGMGAGPFADFDFAAVDADKDGKITEAELTAWQAAKTKALDADGDGFLNAEELAAMEMQGMQARAKDRADRMLTRLDSDGDGKLSAVELAARPVPTGMIDRLDTDKDGAVSEAEVDAAKNRMAEGQGRGWFQKGDRMGKHGRGGNH